MTAAMKVTTITPVDPTTIREFTATLRRVHNDCAAVKATVTWDLLARACILSGTTHHPVTAGGVMRNPAALAWLLHEAYLVQAHRSDGPTLIDWHAIALYAATRGWYNKPVMSQTERQQYNSTRRAANTRAQRDRRHRQRETAEQAMLTTHP